MDNFRDEQHLALREQVAIVRALADQLECLLGTRPMSGSATQLAEELSRLAHMLLDAAAVLSKVRDEPRCTAHS